MMRQVLFFFVCLSLVSALRIDIGTNEDIQPAIDSAIVGVTQGNVDIYFSNSSVYVGILVQLQNYPGLNFTIYGQNATFQGCTFSFTNVHSVHLDGLRAQGTAVNRILMFNSIMGNVTVTNSQFSSATSYAYIVAVDVYSTLHIDQCTFTDTNLVGGSSDAGISTSGTIPRIDITSVTFLNGVGDRPLFGLKSNTDNVYMFNLIIDSVTSSQLEGIINCALTSKNANLTLTSSLFSNLWGQYGAPFKLSQGDWDTVSLTHNQFLANIAMGQIYIDWYTSCKNLIITDNTFSQALPLIVGIGKRTINSAVVIISGTHVFVDFSRNTAQNCLMGKDTAFFSFMNTYGPAYAKVLEMSDNVIVQNQLTPIMFNDARVDNVYIRRSIIQFNSALSVNPLGGVITSVGSSIGNISIVDTDISYNNGPSGGVYIESSLNVLVLRNVTAVNNQGAGNGGFLAVTASPLIDIAWCLFRSNVAVNTGGALYISRFTSGSSIRDSAFRYNTVTADGAQGGGLSLSGYSGTYPMVLSNCSFEFNSGQNGAAIYSAQYFEMHDGYFTGHPPTQSVVYDTRGFKIYTTTFTDYFVKAGENGMLYSKPSVLSPYTFENCNMTNRWNHRVVGSVNTYTFRSNYFTNRLDSKALNLTDVMYLYLEHNNIPAGVDPTLISQFNNALVYLSMKNNSLTSTSITATSYPPKLTYLDLSSNRLTDKENIPYSSLTSLTTLQVYDNLFTDPAEFSGLGKIETLNISGNLLKGPVSAFSSLTSLKQLAVDRNNLTGTLELRTLTNLIELSASHNNIGGNIPASITALTKLTTLTINHNKIYGDLPLMNGMVLQNINMSSNNLNGTSLTSLVSLKQIRSIDLSNNQIQADLSVLNGVTTLNTLWMSRNTLINFDKLNLSPSMTSLQLDYCSLSGVIPETFGALNKLKYASLSGNGITGIPTNMSSLTSLDTLILSHNELSNNQDISQYNALSTLKTLNLDDNKYTSGLGVLKDLTNLTALYFSRNFLGDQISLLGNLNTLQVLDLSHNQLTGGFTETLGGFVGLNHLDLSNNNIQGNLPSSMSSLTQLTYIDMSHNKISGSVDFVPFAPQLAVCDFSDNSFNCPIAWSAFTICSISCSPDSTKSATVRLRIQGDVSTFEPEGYLKSLSTMVNITKSRIKITSTQSGSVITDLLVEPPSPTAINEASAPYVVNYWKTTNRSNFEQYGITLLSASDVPPAGPLTLPLWAIIAIAAGSAVIVLLVVGLIVFIVMRRREKRKDATIKDLSMGENLTYSVIDRDATYSTMNLSPSALEKLAKDAVELIEKIGEGAYGVVYKAKYRGQMVAMKQVRTVSLDIVEDFMSEVELMKAISPHPNVVQFIGFCAKPLALITEFMEGGDLCTYLKKNSRMSYEMKINIIRGVADGMAHLSSQRVLHKDLAARNVLLTRDLVPKVSDFGLSRILDKEAETHQSKTNVGPLKWMAPESLRGIFSEKSDVWSFGVFCIEVMTGTEPYPHLTAAEFIVRAHQDQLHHKMLQQIPQREMDSILSHVLMNVFEFEPNSRPTFASVSSWLLKCNNH